jgi:hypothetical protein
VDDNGPLAGLVDDNGTQMMGGPMSESSALRASARPARAKNAEPFTAHTLKGVAEKTELGEATRNRACIDARRASRASPSPTL